MKLWLLIQKLFSGLDDLDWGFRSRSRSRVKRIQAQRINGSEGAVFEFKIDNVTILTAASRDCVSSLVHHCRNMKLVH